MLLKPELYQGPSKPFAFSTGPKSARIAIVGGNWGQQENLVQMPFMGHSGQLLTQLLEEAGIARSACFLSVVFPIRPLDNDIENLCVPKAQIPPDYTYPPLKQGKYFHPAIVAERDRLIAELEVVRPNIVIALGNTACWALLGRCNIGNIRGTTVQSELGIKVLPTYDPSAILRDWSMRTITIFDLMKAKRESKYPEIKRPERYVTLSASLDEIEDWLSRPAERYAVDIETYAGQITMIGFARNPQDAVVIPFVDMHAPNHHFWQDPADEVRAWKLMDKALRSPIPKLFQNGIYDMGYIMRQGFTVVNPADDTMLLHHALYPELKKGLGFLGSIYCDEASWKIMRTNHGADAFKKDE